MRHSGERRSRPAAASPCCRRCRFGPLLNRWSRKKGKKLQPMESVSQQYLQEDELSDNDIRCRNKSIVKEAKETLEVALLLGLQPTISKEQALRKLVELEEQDEMGKDLP